MSEGWLGYAQTYLWIGAVYLIVLRSYTYFRYGRRENSELARLAATLEAERKGEQKTLKSRLILLGQWLVLWMFWPVAFIGLWEIVRDLRGIRNRRHGTDEPRFACQHDDLIEQVDPLQAEQDNQVFDPLERVPQIPFGHLHSGWITLLSQLEPGDTLWRFKTPGDGEASDEPPRYAAGRRSMAGYAVVRGKKVVWEFVTERD